VAFSKPHARQKRIDLGQLGQAGTIAVLVSEGFAAADLTLVAGAAERAGYKTAVISLNKSLVAGRSETNEEMNFVVDGAPGDQDPKSFAGLLVPGGDANIDRLSADQDARLMLMDFMRAKKPVCVMGKAVSFLADAAEKDGVAGDAALALNGEIFASTGETARDDAASMFVKAMDMVDGKAA
jgi:putative intracellular protease/amidase